MNSLHKIHLIMSISISAIISSCGQNSKTEKMKFDINKSEEDWKKKLSEEQYYILREKGTERPHSGKFLMHKDKGNYTCAACGNILFSSDSKFDSHCGWPSFDKQIGEKNIVTKEDKTHGMSRTEIMCGKCGGHLGHIFDDGPTATGMRYCVNSVSLGFEAVAAPKIEKEVPSAIDTIALAGGCFWCIEAIFQELKGVKKVESGFAGGGTGEVSYKEVCSGNTGHAEVIQITFDTKEISLAQILKVFFTVHDPTTLNRQGADVGTQYRSSVFYRNEMQKKLAQEIISGLVKEKAYDKPIVTQIERFDTFIKAEDYHQNYFKNNGSQPYCRMVIQPKVEKFEKVFKHLIK